MMILTS